MIIHMPANILNMHNVNWWPTPPRSPDLKPIENIWGSLKQYLRTSYRPRNLEELKNGIEKLCHTCTRGVSTLHQSHIKGHAQNCQCTRSINSTNSY